MNRTLLQQLATERLTDAQALLNAGRWSGAYYLAGYAVECALKACIAKLTKAENFPDKDFAAKCFTHNLEKLIDLAQLKSEHAAFSATSIEFTQAWSLVKDWSEQSRYTIIADSVAKKMVEAVTHPQYGVYQWLTIHW